MTAIGANFTTLARKPSAYLPIAMSLCALAVVWLAVQFLGEHRKPDEDAAAHLFQLLIAGQAPFIAWFLARWGRSSAKDAITILAAQLLAIAIALAPVWYLDL